MIIIFPLKELGENGELFCHFAVLIFLLGFLVQILTPLYFCSIFVCSAFVNTLGAGNNIPYLALPFNLIAVCTFLTIQPSQVEDDQETTTLNTTDINWCQVGRGIAVSMGQVYAINDVPASSLMNLAVFLASPLLFIMSTIGAVLGSLAGVLILPAENLPEVYDGIWGYNAVIATSSITCVFFAFSSMSFTLGMINLLATIGAQYALRATMVLQVQHYRVQ